MKQIQNWLQVRLYNREKVYGQGLSEGEVYRQEQDQVITSVRCGQYKKYRNQLVMRVHPRPYPVAAR